MGNLEIIITGEESWHGSVNGFDNYNFRCDDCTLAKKVYNQHWNLENPEQARMYKERRRARVINAFVEDVDAREIYERDGYLCHICGQAVDPGLKYPDPMSASLDHIIPLAAGIEAGGLHSRTNVAMAHLRCNIKKGPRVSPKEPPPC